MIKSVFIFILSLLLFIFFQPHLVFYGFSFPFGLDRFNELLIDIQNEQIIFYSKFLDNEYKDEFFIERVRIIQSQIFDEFYSSGAQWDVLYEKLKISVDLMNGFDDSWFDEKYKINAAIKNIEDKIK